MNGADSEPRRQLPTTAAREMTASQPKRRQLCVEYGGLLEIVFFAIKVIFAGYQFMTDFYSQNRCVCSTRSHGPLLCAFCLSFHFKAPHDIGHSQKMLNSAINWKIFGLDPLTQIIQT